MICSLLPIPEKQSMITTCTIAQDNPVTIPSSGITITEELTSSIKLIWLTSSKLTVVMSGYSARGFEYPNAKHTTSFEGKVPEARDSETFPNRKDQSRTRASTPPATSSSGLSGPYSATGFASNISGKQQSAYTAKGFLGRL